jgi:cytoskeleton protein RodZ
MEESQATFTYESLGTLLRKTRLERSLDIAEVAQETRIPPETVRAMEADDYAALPAMAFARGFYSLYAKLLDLDQDEVLQRFTDEYQNADYDSGERTVYSTQWHGKDIGSIAERPSPSAGPIISISLIVIVLAAAGISWYAGYNPAKQISNWLKSFQEPEVEVVLEKAPAPEDTRSEVPTGTDLQAVEPVEETEAAEIVFQPPEPPVIQPVAEPRYQLIAEFQDPAEIVLTLDEDAPQRVSMMGGSIETWQADEQIVLEIPAGAGVRLYLNGIVVPLPPAEDGTITVSIPQYFLE